MSTRTIDIPSSVATRYVAVTDGPVTDPERLARDYFTTLPAADRPLLGEARPVLQIRSIAANESPCRNELVRVLAIDDEQQVLKTARSHLIVDSEVSSGSQPRASQQLRATARFLAEATSGLLVDLASAQVVVPIRGVSGERGWLRLADRWLSFDCLIDPAADTTASPRECSCLCLFTRGMTKFGLPDLAVDQIACAHDLAATNVLRGLAVQLLTRLWDDPNVRKLSIDDRLIVTPDHMWGYWGARPLLGQPVAIHLVEPLKPELPQERYLEVLPHPDFNGTRVDWGNDVLGQGLPSVAGWQPDDPPYRIDHSVPQ